jgi:hypothetical protein
MICEEVLHRHLLRCDKFENGDYTNAFLESYELIEKECLKKARTGVYLCVRECFVVCAYLFVSACICFFFSCTPARTSVWCVCEHRCGVYVCTRMHIVQLRIPEYTFAVHLYTCTSVCVCVCVCTHIYALHNRT